MQDGDALMIGESCPQEEKGPGWKAIQQGQQRSVLLIIDQSSVRGEEGWQRCVLGRKDPGEDPGESVTGGEGWVRSETGQQQQCRKVGCE